MRKECLKGRRGRGADGQAKTREVRLACLFTQTRIDAKSGPVRDPASTTYQTCMGSADHFASQVRAEACRRGMTAAGRTVILSDGARWCTKLAARNFPGHLHILDFYHAAEHVRELSLALLGEGEPSALRFREWREALLHGHAAAVIAAARSILPQARVRKAAKQHLAYLRTNLPRMHYDRYRAQGLFIGSGVVEAGCRTIVTQRAKLSGMFWGEQGVQDVLALRCLLFSDRFDPFWKHVTAQLRVA
jgi:hypothetical protein